MKIIDAQIHIWGKGTPSGLHRKVSSFTAEEALREMDEAGVHAAVIHPPVLFCSFIQRGTLSSMVAAQMTLVFPNEISTEPWACGAIPLSRVTGRISWGWRLAWRFIKNRSLMARRPLRQEGSFAQKPLLDAL
jgi:hypothetical protein